MTQNVTPKNERARVLPQRDYRNPLPITNSVPNVRYPQCFQFFSLTKLLSRPSLHLSIAVMADDPALPHNCTMRLHAIARWGTKELHDGKAYVKQVWVRSCWFTGLQRGSLCLQDMATGTGWEN